MPHMKRISLILSMTIFTVSTFAQLTDNLKMVDSTSSFGRISTAVQRGLLIKTSNFHFYEVNDKINQKLSNQQPSIIVYQDGKKYKMKIEGIDKLLACNKIQEVIESNIDGDFKGWDGNSTFKLANQQEWKQDGSTGTLFSNLFRPAVLIYLTAEGYKMKVTGVDEDPILVKKIR